MKGPGYKLSHDVRRTWRCPACGFERKLMGDVTSLICNCRPEGTFMVIAVERTVAPRPLQIPQEHDVRSSEFGIDDMPVLQPHPSSLPPERTGPRRPRPEPGRGAEPTVAPRSAQPADGTSDGSPPVAQTPPNEPAAPPPATEESGDDWGEGILES